MNRNRIKIILIVLLILLFCQLVSCDMLFYAKKNEAYIVAFSNQVPFETYDSKTDKYLKLAEDSFGRELVYLEGVKLHYYWDSKTKDYVDAKIYLICKPNKDSVTVYDNYCFMYSKEEIDFNSEKMNNFLEINDWDKEINIEKIATYSYNLSNNSSDLFTDEIIEKTQNEAGVSIENGLCETLVTANGKRFAIIHNVVNFRGGKPYTERETYVYAIDVHGTPVHVQRITGEPMEWQAQLADYKKIISEDDSIKAE